MAGERCDKCGWSMGDMRPVYASIAEKDAKLAKLSEENARLRQELNDWRQFGFAQVGPPITCDQDMRDGIEAQLRELREENARLKQELETAQQVMAEACATNDALRQELENKDHCARLDRPHVLALIELLRDSALPGELVLAAAVREIRRLRQELEDVRYLDNQPGSWSVTTHYPGDPARAYSCMAITGPVGKPFLAGTPAEARRAAVEFIKSPK